MNRLKTALAKFLRVHFYVSLGVSAFLLSLGSALVQDEPVSGFLLMGAAGVFGLLGVRSRLGADIDRKLQAEQYDIAEKRAQEMATAISQARSTGKSALEASLAATLAFGGLGASDRVSIYLREEQGWARLGRFSNNLLFMRSGRSVIPLRQGVVHEAHVQGEFSVDLAEVGSDEYFLEQRSYGVTKVVAKAFAMPVRSYFGLGLRRPGFRDRDIVVLFESVEEHALEAGVLRTIVNEEYSSLLVNLCALEGLLSDASSP